MGDRTAFLLTLPPKFGAAHLFSRHGIGSSGTRYEAECSFLGVRADEGVMAGLYPD